MKSSLQCFPCIDEEMEIDGDNKKLKSSLSSSSGYLERDMGSSGIRINLKNDVRVFVDSSSTSTNQVDMQCFPCINDEMRIDGDNKVLNSLISPSSNSGQIQRDMSSSRNHITLNKDFRVMVDSSSINTTNQGSDVSDSVSIDSLFGTSVNTEPCSKKLQSDTELLQESIRNTAELLDKWNSELKLDVYVFDQFRSEFNVLEAIEPNKRLLLPYIYFDPYKFPCHEGFDGEGWRNLLHHLEREAHTQGFCIHSNGYGRGGKNKYRRLVCKHGILYRNSLNDRKAVPSFLRNYKFVMVK